MLPLLDFNSHGLFLGPAALLPIFPCYLIAPVIDTQPVGNAITGSLECASEIVVIQASRRNPGQRDHHRRIGPQRLILLEHVERIAPVAFHPAGPDAPVAALVGLGYRGDRGGCFDPVHYLTSTIPASTRSARVSALPRIQHSKTSSRGTSRITRSMRWWHSWHAIAHSRSEPLNPMPPFAIGGCAIIVFSGSKLHTPGSLIVQSRPRANSVIFFDRMVIR